MVRMRANYECRAHAARLRRLGYSVAEIAQNLNVSKSSVSLWVRDIILSQKARVRLVHRQIRGRAYASVVRRNATQMRVEEADVFAKSVVGSTSMETNTMRLLCSLLYWCEGEKSLQGKTFAFTNSDPLLVSTFLRFLREGFDIDEQKFRICLHIHAYHDEKKQITFWFDICGIPEAQFMKSHQKQSSGRQKKRDYAGCVSVRYYDARIARQVQALARAFLKKYGAYSSKAEYLSPKEQI